MKAVALISEGIDSPVAAHLMASRGMDITLFFLDNWDEASPLDKVRAITRKLEESLGTDLPLYRLPYREAQEAISKACRREYQCVLCKRFMLRAAEKLASEVAAVALVTGDSLGQVASQTLHNLLAVQRGIRLPVLRPLIGLDKNEIEAMAREIGTYALSIQPSPSCPFVPTRPKTMTKVDRLEEEVDRLDAERMERMIGNFRPVTP